MSKQRPARSGVPYPLHGAQAQGGGQGALDRRVTERTGKPLTYITGYVHHNYSQVPVTVPSDWVKAIADVIRMESH